MDEYLSPPVLTFGLLLYAYFQARALIRWSGNWRLLAALTMGGEAYWLIARAASNEGLSLPAAFVAAMVGIALLGVLAATQALLRSAH